MIKQVIELFEIMDSSTVTGEDIEALFRSKKDGIDFKITRIDGIKKPVDFICIRIEGKSGKRAGGKAPTLGIIGTLGGIGARPEVCGFVSDGDGALAALAAGLKILDMKNKGDELDGDVIITTHICPFTPTLPNYPVPFMDSPVSDEILNENTVYEEMDAIISIDTTKGNQIVNHKGFAITSTVKEGYVLKVSNDLLEIMKRTTGKLPVVLPISQQDITPYGNGISHINSIMQPSVATDVGVVGLAITTEVPVAGCASGATHIVDIEQAARFVVEVAKDFGRNQCHFYDKEEFARLKRLYGKQNKFQTQGLNSNRKVGIITMGFSKDFRIEEDIEDILVPKFEVTIAGILDGYSIENAKTRFWPEKEESFIIMSIGNNEIIKISEKNAYQLINEKIKELEDNNIMCSMLMCTGHFPKFSYEGMLIKPEDIIYSFLKGLGVKKIGIIVPEEEQIKDSFKQYSEFSPQIVASSPYGEVEDIKNICAKFHEDLDLILLDCMGFTEDIKEMVQEITGIATMLPRTLITGVLANLG